MSDNFDAASMVMMDKLSEKNTALESENQRLRDALSKIASSKPINATGDLVQMTRHDPQRVAQQALNLQESAP